jgi:hypothetical protein
MPIDVKLVRIFIASPGDVPEAREAVVQAMHRWNAVHGVNHKIQYLPTRWEQATPQLGAHPQEVINRQQVDESDGLIGIFYTRLGSKTPNAPSGTAAEIDRCSNSGKTCKIYVCKKDVSQTVLEDPKKKKEFERLKQYKGSLKDRGLLGDFVETAELHDKIYDDLSHWAREFIDAAAAEKKNQNEPVIP